MPNLPRVLIVGAGSIGERHLRCFLATGRATVAFVEPRDELRAAISSRYPQARPHADFQSALNEAVDCVVIATPAPLHVPQAIEALDRGCHVLIEKPLSVTTDDMPRLIELAKSRGKTTAVAYVYRAHPALTAMRQAIRSERFGRPLELVAICGQHFPLHRPAYAQTYYKDRATGGGAIQDALTHIINAGQWLVGDLDRLVADAAHLRLAEVEVEDTVHVLARHGEVLASYALNQHQAPNETTITVICEGGTARFEYHKNRWRTVVEPGADWENHPGDPLERDELFRRQANAFLDACCAGSRPLCDLYEGLATLQANLAILRSVESGQWESLGKDHQ